jgi:hypothetical protein
MLDTLLSLIGRFETPALRECRIIPWGSPVPSFGDLSQSQIATVGLNPSNLEFVDAQGNELSGESRRFHTFSSLGITRWSQVSTKHAGMIVKSCREYFYRNPYNTWFRRLDQVISGTGASYYGPSAAACHLDLIPYATACKWTSLTPGQRSSLLTACSDTLAMLLRDAPVQVLILNGSSVVKHFEIISGTSLEKAPMPDWALARRSGRSVSGFAYRGFVHALAGIPMGRGIEILGFNHNIQSSFGVRKEVIEAIRRWITRTASKVMS